MTGTNDHDVALHEYEDPFEGFRGYLAYAGDRKPLAAGGFRVHAGLTAETVAALARAMRLKENILQLNVDGAKCGIDYDHLSPGKHAAMRRFLRWLKPHLDHRLSLGPDMGTTFSEIEGLAAAEGISSVKAAIARAQGLDREEVLIRVRTLDFPAGSSTLGQRRAGHALAHATFAAARETMGSSEEPIRCAIQGFGTLARGAALTMHEASVVVTAIADEYGCIRHDEGLDLGRLLASRHGTPVVDVLGSSVSTGERTEVFGAPADVLVLAACEDAMNESDLERLRARVVVLGANNGLRSEVEDELLARGIVVVPDFVGGAGGSAAMDALFAPLSCPDPTTVLTRVALIARMLVDRTLDTAREAGVSPRAAALALADDTELPPDSTPYGLRLLETIEYPPPPGWFGTPRPPAAAPGTP